MLLPMHQGVETSRAYIHLLLEPAAIVSKGKSRLPCSCEGFRVSVALDTPRPQGSNSKFGERIARSDNLIAHERP